MMKIKLIKNQAFTNIVNFFESLMNKSHVKMLFESLFEFCSRKVGFQMLETTLYFLCIEKVYHEPFESNISIRKANQMKELFQKFRKNNIFFIYIFINLIIIRAHKIR